MLVTVAAITGSNYTSYGSYALMLVGAAACIWVPLSFFPRLRGRKVFAEICVVVGVAAAIAKVTTGFGPTLSSAAPPAPSAPEPASVVITPVPHPTTAPAAGDAGDDLPIGKPQETASAKPAEAKPLLMKPAPANAPAAKPAPDRDLGDVYTDHANGYSIRFPAAWTSTQFTGGDPWFIEVSDGKTGLVSVGFSPFPASAGLDQLKPASLAAHLQGQRQTTVEAQGYGTINGQKCLWFRYTGPVKSATGEQPMTVIHYYLPLHDGRMFELRLAALPDAFPKVASVFKKSAATVKLSPM